MFPCKWTAYGNSCGGQEKHLTRTVITLTTDFGSADHLVGTMKGVILNINPDVEIVDITHSVLPYDLLDGALAIGQAYKYFPPKTVHVVVVDPGVGTNRPAAAGERGNAVFRRAR